MSEADVVVGIILDGNKFLVERRKLDEKIDPDIVCLPGGHVNADESIEEALKREMLEELDIKVINMKLVCKNFYIASNGEKQNASCFLISEYEGAPHCKSAQKIFWEEDINNLSLDVDKKTIRVLRKMQGTR